MAGDLAAPLPPNGFEVVRRGYDQAQVEAHLRRLDAEMRILATDRDAAVDQSAHLTRELDDSRARAERLRAQVRTLVSPQQSVQGMSERMRSMLRMAEDEVAEMLAKAGAEVTRSLHDAEQKASEVLASARAEADTTRTRIAAETHAAEERDARRRTDLAAEEGLHHERLQTTNESAERDLAAARARLAAERQEHVESSSAADTAAEQGRDAAWAASESRRHQVEADFRIAMDQRRKEALTALTAEQIATRAATEEMREQADEQARRTVDAAHAQASDIMADAEAAVVSLLAQRSRMVAQLRGSRSDLDTLLASLVPLPGEQAGPRPDAQAAYTYSDADTTPLPHTTPPFAAPSPRASPDGVVVTPTSPPTDDAAAHMAASPAGPTATTPIEALAEPVADVPPLSSAEQTPVADDGPDALAPGSDADEGGEQAPDGTPPGTAPDPAHRPHLRRRTGATAVR